eukprot:CAMPEP_0194294046 /NCGR_PEP_ID=MMETSP0169-20130528/49489_1 /TAXON_ID=218684 /ORGANISM="Corethron pennatum, Strain L29A3" /LENGTH=256 /DNA_ID=CAMNT_0039042775 /DNA_START=20 /DNA_END=790 /DNA_ORIENTATION=-
MWRTLLICLLARSSCSAVPPRPTPTVSGTAFIDPVRMPSRRRDQLPAAAAHAPKKETGDPLRRDRRPSLIPTTVNAVATALLERAEKGSGSDLDVSEPPEDGMIAVALAAGRIASNALAQRSAFAEGGTEVPDESESQTLAGRVVGIVMRLPDLEGELVEKVKGAKWVKKYAEEGSFGVDRSELESGDGKGLRDRILGDPLFRMNRAECLLAMFIETVESPALKKLRAKGEKDMPEISEVDFIDADRLQVLKSDPA